MAEHAATSVQSLANTIGVTRRTLQDWLARGCPRDSVDAVIAWRAANIKSPDAPVVGTADSERQARIRKLNADAEARELKNAQLRGELYEAADVERQVAELTSMVRCRLESIPDDLQMEWPAELRAAVTQRMAEKIHLILTQMSHWRLEVDVSTGDSESTAASEAENDSMVPG